MSIKPWREIAVPHEDVLKGTFQQAEFAADLTLVHDGKATAEYQNPVLFFERTYITEGMRLLLDSVIRRLSSKGGDPVIQLKTSFGGGKTHTLLAVYHLASAKTAPSRLAGISAIMDTAKITELPKARIVVLDGIKQSPSQPVKHGKIAIHTLWGDLAWQLGKEEGYERVKDSDLKGTQPGKTVLMELLAAYAPCVILMDELVAYIRQFEEGKSYTGGTFESNLSFIQSITEAVKGVPNAILLASLPDSHQAGGPRGVLALNALEDYFKRLQAIWKPVGTEEAFSIVRRRLFETIKDTVAVDSACQSFADFYNTVKNELPSEAQETRYFNRMKDAYPIHPEVFDRLYEDWSTLENFQRTRGVLKMMAKVIHRLWVDNNRDAFIMPGSIPLYDGEVRNETIQYLPQGWDPVVERDIDGDRSEAAAIDNGDTRFGVIQAARRVSRSIFMGSAPTTSNQVARGVDMNHVLLGCVQPGQSVALYKDAIRRLTERLHFLNSGNDRFWFDTKANLRREMEERKRRFSEEEEVRPNIRTTLLVLFAGNHVFAGSHMFTVLSDVPDDNGLRLYVLPPDVAYARTGRSTAVERAAEVLKVRGEQPRQRQNRLVFLAADFDSVGRLKDQVRSMLAWKSIVDDNNEGKLNLDTFQAKQARKSQADAEEGVKHMVREAYKWVLVPCQEAKQGKVSDMEWQAFAVSSSAPNIAVEIERVLKDSEALILEWAPVHLKNILKEWFWKDGVSEVSALDVYQKFSNYLYFPRLKDESVFRAALSAGAASTDFFGFAYGKTNGKYEGFSFGKATSPVLDGALLLIEPSAAAAYAETIKAPDVVPGKPDDVSSPVQPPAGGAPKGGQTPVSPPAGGQKKKRFYGTIALDPAKAKMQFANIADEVVQHFNMRPDAEVTISIEIRAETRSGFDEGIQRTVRENCKELKFGNAEFEG